jgi:WD40 repeat protein
MALDERTLQPLWEAHDCQHAILDIKYSPSGEMVAVATADRHIDVYSAAEAKYSKQARCIGHSALVLHIDWSKDSQLLQSACAARELLYWAAATGKQVTRSQRDTSWASWTSMLGFPVVGIWSGAGDASDVNAVDRDLGGDLLVTADDSGQVRLFNYPCVIESAPSRTYRGHSSHVACVRFSTSGRWVSSAGSLDRAVLQFRVEAPKPVHEPEPTPEPVWGPLDASGRLFGWTSKPLPVDAGIKRLASIHEVEEHDDDVILAHKTE